MYHKTVLKVFSFYTRSCKGWSPVLPQHLLLVVVLIQWRSRKIWKTKKMVHLNTDLYTTVNQNLISPLFTLAPLHDSTKLKIRMKLLHFNIFSVLYWNIIKLLEPLDICVPWYRDPEMVKNAGHWPTNFANVRQLFSNIGHKKIVHTYTCKLQSAWFYPGYLFPNCLLEIIWQVYVNIN